MPKRPRRPTDMNQLAAAVVAEATGTAPEVAPESRKAAAGRLGGLTGGKARAAKLSKKRRSEIAKKAAKARWGFKSS